MIDTNTLAKMITAKRIFTHPGYIADELGADIADVEAALAELPDTQTKVDADGTIRYRIDPR